MVAQTHHGSALPACRHAKAQLPVTREVVRHDHLRIASQRRASDVSGRVLKDTDFTSGQGTPPTTPMELALLRKAMEFCTARGRQNN